MFLGKIYGGWFSSVIFAYYLSDQSRLSSAWLHAPSSIQSREDGD
jgi:hypothetical protein